MKKKNLQSLKLQKQLISNLAKETIKGAGDQSGIPFICLSRNFCQNK